MTSDVLSDLMTRASGPMDFRLMAPLLLAVLTAAVDGLRDARHGLGGYMLALAAHRDISVWRHTEAWLAVATVFAVAMVGDIVVQAYFSAQIDFGLAGAIAVLFCAFPYALLRGPASRLFARLELV